MAKGKVKIAWIEKDSTRRAIFKKRTAGLIKKVSEIAVLCGVEACAVVYGPTEAETPNSTTAGVASVWPSAPEAARLLEDFRRSPEMVQCQKMMDRDGFLGQQIRKLQDQLRKQANENHSLETNILMHDALYTDGSLIQRIASIESVGSLVQAIERTMWEVRQRMERATLQALPPVESGNFDYGGANGGDIMQQFANDCVATWPNPFFDLNYSSF